MNDSQLAHYIITWLMSRNDHQIGRLAMNQLTMADHQLLLNELQLILSYRGKPPNWTE